jgi:electron transfer flavoprotein beta subunit
MKILVPTKRVPDPDQNIRVRDDAGGIDDNDLVFVINPFDAIALEEALRVREGSSKATEVLAIGIGADDYEQQLRVALAMGADRAVLVECTEPLDPWNVARILQAAVDREQPDLVLMGKQAVDDDAGQTGQILAALLDWPQATFASKIDFVEDTVRVARETDAGIEVVRVGLPAVITTDLRLNEPRYVSLPSMLKAKNKPIEWVSLQDQNIAIQPRIQILQMETTATGRNCERVASVEMLIDRLRNEAKVI